MILNIIIILIASTADAIMDTISSHYPISVFAKVSDWKFLKKFKYCNKVKLYQWLNPYYSWKNKWKNGDKLQGERFLGSSTIFVLFTDAWHLFQSIQLNLFFVFAWFAYNPELTKLQNLYCFIVYRIIYGLWFTLLNDYVLIKKKLL